MARIFVSHATDDLALAREVHGWIDGAALRPGGLLSRGFLGTRPMVWMGTRSYGLYLWHWPIYVYTRPEIEVPWGPVPTAAVRIALTVLAAELSYRLVELPIRDGRAGRWLRELAGPRRRWVTAGAVAASLLVAAPVVTGIAAAAPRPDVVEQRVVAGATVATAASSATPVTSGLGELEPHTVTVLADSVLLGIENALVAELAADGWTVEYRGRPALMVKQSRAQLAESGARVGSLVVVGLGYNSLWERDRAHYDRWAATWDREAEELVAVLTELGAKRVVWVTLREPSPEVVPPKGRAQLRLFAWTFPYTNERLRALHERRPEVLSPTGRPCRTGRA
ncbi:MAG: acyltransferase family protein [Pseudonocardia sp.]